MNRHDFLVALSAALMGSLVGCVVFRVFILK